MAIIVDKVQKRQDIALSCVELFTQSGIDELTIAQVAKTAGVGKGTIYEYFENKEDIVFEIANILMQRHNERKREKLLHATSTREKLKIFFDFYYTQEDIEHREIYKESISITLRNPNHAMLEFQTRCYERYFAWVEEIVQEGIDAQELLPHAMNLVKGLFAFAKGIYIVKSTTTSIRDIQSEINDYIDALFELLEVKK
jgi:AcrR family transcriptional regulator